MGRSSGKAIHTQSSHPSDTGICVVLSCSLVFKATWDGPVVSGSKHDFFWSPMTVFIRDIIWFLPVFSSEEERND